MKKKQILIAGGTGLIGSRLSELLQKEGHAVTILSRKARPTQQQQATWQPDQFNIEDALFKQADVIVNLAGAGIADGRWTPARKKLIVDSRVHAAITFQKAIERTGHCPECYLAASAIGYYGNAGERWMSENDLPATDEFLSVTTQKWESATDLIGLRGIRTVKLRIGVVLSVRGGALQQIIRPLPFGVAPFFSDGRAWYSWVHLDDVCRMFIWAMENPLAKGVFNAVAPHPVRNRDLVRLASKVFQPLALPLPTPAFVLRMMLGEMSAIVLNSTRVSAQKIMDAGFQFQFPDFMTALQDLKTRRL